MKRFLVFFALLLLAAGPPLQASGRAWLDADSLEIKSGFATWNPSSRLLRLMLLPYQPTSEQMSWVEKFPEADYQVVESPQRPFVRLDMTLAEGATGEFRADQVKFWNLSLWRLGAARKGSYSIQHQKLKGSLKLTGDFRAGKPIRFEARGEQSSQYLVKWSFQGYCRVLVVPGKPK
ncbi:hypothetical protein DYH09_03535 [bacterium CPR1]|nr:hypothetical protein [bacterium CPR1]